MMNLKVSDGNFEVDVSLDLKWEGSEISIYVYLLSIAQCKSDRLCAQTSQSSIAEATSLNRATVNRVLRRFEDQGLVRISRGRHAILTYVLGEVRNNQSFLYGKSRV